jgi:putative redox protein
MKVAVQRIDGMRYLATAAQHSIAVDALPQDGGAGTAPSAPQLFVAAVGACILEFVVNSCRLQGLAFEELSLEVVGAEESGPRRISAIEVTIHIEPEPAEDVKRRLVAVAAHATLVNTLLRPPEVTIRTVGHGQ